MLSGKKIVFMMVLDRNNYSFKGLTRRVMDHHAAVISKAEDSPVVVGRVTQELTGWKGKFLTVVTHDLEWTRNRVRVVRSIEDAIEGPGDTAYIAGGVSVFRQAEPFVDEYMLWTVHSRDGDEPCTSMIPSKWRPVSYSRDNNWTFAHLKKSKR